MRLSRRIAGLARSRRPLGPADWRVQFRPSAVARRRCPGLPDRLVCRLVKYQRAGFRPSWLLTSLLSVEAATRDELIELYHRRWSIETIYREWKHGMDIENLRSHTPAGILKEVHAQLILSNLVRWIMTESAGKTTQTPLEFSFLSTLTLLKTVLPSLLLHPGRSPAIMAYQRLLVEIRSTLIRQRPGRSYPRPGDGKLKNKGGGRYQLPAKLQRIA
jgi:hypothetical protein